jgi:hypothetical protein
MSDKIYYCCISGEVIPQARVEFLIDSGLPEERWTVVTHSLVQRKKGVYFGGVCGNEDDVGELGELVVVDKVYNDSASSILGNVEGEKEPEEEELP